MLYSHDIYIVHIIKNKMLNWLIKSSLQKSVIFFFIIVFFILLILTFVL